MCRQVIFNKIGNKRARFHVSEPRVQLRGGLERAVEEKDSKKEMMQICRMVIRKKERKIKTNLTSIFVKLHFGV